MRVCVYVWMYVWVYVQCAGEMLITLSTKIYPEYNTTPTTQPASVSSLSCCCSSSELALDVQLTEVQLGEGWS